MKNQIKIENVRMFECHPVTAARISGASEEGVEYTVQEALLERRPGGGSLLHFTGETLGVFRASALAGNLLPLLLPLASEGAPAFAFEDDEEAALVEFEPVTEKILAH